jgi:hypothetical protein
VAKINGDRLVKAAHNNNLMAASGILAGLRLDDEIVYRTSAHSKGIDSYAR